MDAKSLASISLLIRIILLLQTQDVICQVQTEPKVCTNNKLYATNRDAIMKMSHSEAMAYCLRKRYRIATMDSNDPDAFARIISDCALPIPASQYWISETTPLRSCWKLSFVSTIGAASPLVETERCEAKLPHALCEVPSNLTSGPTISSPKASSTPAQMLQTENLLPSFTSDNRLSVSTSSMSSWTDLQHSTHSYQTPFTIAGTTSKQFSVMPGESELSPKVSLWSETTGTFDGISSKKSSLDLEQATTADISTIIVSSVTEKPASSDSFTDSYQVTATSTNAIDTQNMTTKMTGLSPENALISEWRQLDTHEYLVNTMPLPLDEAHVFCRNVSNASLLSCPSVTRCMDIAHRLNLSHGEYWSADQSDDLSDAGLVFRWPELFFKMAAHNSSKYTICCRMTNSTLESIQANFTRMLNEMKVAPKNTAKALLKLSSAKDDRLSAQIGGAFSVAFICSIVVMIVAVDAVNLVRRWQRERTPA